MNPTEQELLAQLRDAHAPLDPGWWPPAPGWWLLALVIVVAVSALSWWLHDRRQPHWRKSARQVLDQLAERKLQTPGDCSAVLTECSTLMRRVALAVHPRATVAHLTDSHWLERLDSIGRTDEYSAGVGRLLTRHPYMAPGRVSADQVTRLLKLMYQTINRAELTPTVTSAVAQSNGAQELSGESRLAQAIVRTAVAGSVSTEKKPEIKSVEQPVAPAPDGSAVPVPEVSEALMRYRKSGAANAKSPKQEQSSVRF